jgi:hypothetical protein
MSTFHLRRLEVLKGGVEKVQGSEDEYDHGGPPDEETSA